PMLFDRAPVAPTDDIAVQIPDRNTPFEGRSGVPRDNAAASKGPLRPSSSLPLPSSTTPGATSSASTSTSTEVAPPAVAPVDAAKAAAPKDIPSEKPAEKTSDKSADKAVPKAVEKNVEKSAEKSAEKHAEKSSEKSASAAAQADDPRALAALEGKPVPNASAEPASGRGFAVQIAAYSVADKARNMRDRLAANGLKAYIEPLSTSQGTRTRVRLGPFASREAAEHAREKLKTMKLDGAVIAL
ncbi:MAG: SPOR domain-containing protein, partial [Burkholderiaceae bacterium]